MLWNKPIKNSIIFYNFILPIIFFELWNVLLAFTFVVIIEILLISKLTKISIKELYKVVLYANVISTFIGYVAQSFIRMLLFLPISEALGFPKSLNVIAGNLSLESYLSEQGIPFEILINFILSMSFAFFISIYFEKRLIYKKFKDDKRMTIKSIVIANLVTYILLFFWVLDRYMVIKDAFN